MLVTVKNRPPPDFAEPPALKIGHSPLGKWPHVTPKPEVRIVVAYLVIASVWIIWSDHILYSVMPKNTTFIQSFKGLNFVITSAILLFFVLRRAYRGWRRAEREQMALLSEVSETFRHLSTRVESLREADRTRISRELHDQLGQALTGLKLDLRWVENRIEVREDRSLNQVTDRLVEAQDHVDDLIVTVQRISADLRPDALDNLGLSEALTEEAERFFLRTGVPCHAQVDELPDGIPPEIATAAFRIFQEALTNVTRHAQASKVEVSCSLERGILKLCISDDGKGIDAAAAQDTKSLGLLGMRERASLSGGTLIVGPGEKGGTTVEASLPLKGGEP
jgi:signal transduction histidine kinase